MKSQGRYKPRTVNISPVDTASTEQGIHALTMDLHRRAKAEELRSIQITAIDKNGDRLDYRA